MNKLEYEVSMVDTSEIKGFKRDVLAAAKCLQEYVDMHIDDEDCEYELREKSRKALCDLTGDKFEPEPHVVGCWNCFFVHVKSGVCPECGC